MLAAAMLLPWNFSPAFLMGFLNYYSGVGLCFLTATHLIHLNEARRIRAGSLVAHCLLVMLLFLWHLAAFAIYIILSACYLSVDLLRPLVHGEEWRHKLSRLLGLGLTVVPSIILYGVYRGATADLVGTRASWNGPAIKLLNVPVGLFRSYSTGIDLVSIGLWCVAFLVLFRTNPLRRPVGWLHLSLVFFGLAYAIMPSTVGSGGHIDVRFLPPLLVCVLALTTYSRPKGYRLGVALLGLCVLLRGGSVLYEWHRIDQQQREDARAFDLMPENSKIAPVIVESERTLGYSVHFVAWAVPLRQAYVPTLFAVQDQQPLTLTGPLAPPVMRGSHAPVGERNELLAEYDFVWLQNPLGTDVRLPECCRQIFSTARVSLWSTRLCR
jgi:hypothetical protein